MSSVKTYTELSEDLSPPIQGEGFCTDMVRYSDYAALEAKCSALAAEVQAVRWACGQVYMKGYNHGHLNTVDGLDYASDTELVELGGEALADFTDPDHCGVAADAILAEVRAQGVEMFADFWEENCRHNDTFIGGEAKNFADQLRQDANTAELLAAGTTKVEE